MDLMSNLIFVLVLLGVSFFLVAAVGHVLWLAGAAFIKVVFGSEDLSTKVITPELARCLNCNHATQIENQYCGFCGQLRLTALLADLSATERQLNRFYRSESIYESVYTHLKGVVETERLRLTQTTPPTSVQPEPPVISRDENDDTARQSWNEPEWLTISIAEPLPQTVPS